MRPLLLGEGQTIFDLVFEGRLEQLTVEFLPASAAVLSIGLDLHPQLPDLSLQAANILLVLVPRPLRCFPVLLLLHLRPFFLGQLGRGGGFASFFFADVLLFVLLGVLVGDLVVFGGIGGGLALGLAHLLKECFKFN